VVKNESQGDGWQQSQKNKTQSISRTSETALELFKFISQSPRSSHANTLEEIIQQTLFHSSYFEQIHLNENQEMTIHLNM